MFGLMTKTSLNAIVYIYFTLRAKVCAQKSASWYFSFLLTLPGLKGVDHDIFLSPVVGGGEPGMFSPMANAR